MKASGNPDASWSARMTENTPSPKPEVSAHPPEDRDPARIEAAMLELGRAAATASKSTFLAAPIPPDEYPQSNIGWPLRDPVPFALRMARVDLLHHLRDIVGQEASAAANARVNAILFAEFDRPQIDAVGPKQ